MATHDKNNSRNSKGSRNSAQNSGTGRKLKPSSMPQRKSTLKDAKAAGKKGSASGHIFQRMMRRLIRNAKGMSKSLQKDKRILVVILPVIFVILSVFFIWLFTNKNAYEVFVDDTSVGAIAENKNITEALLYETAVAKLVSDMGAEVEVAEKVKIVPVHASKKEKRALDYIVSEIYKKFTYKVEASVIKVDGAELAILSNEKEANEVLENLKAQYVQEGIRLAEEPTFVEDVKVDKRFVEKDEIISSEKAYQKLSQRTNIEKTYTTASGDTLWGISIEAGMDLDDLVALNPGLDINAGLKIGQELILLVPKPMLSIKTIEEKTYTTVAEKPIEKKENKNEYKTFSRVIQQGRDGRKEVTEHIIRINGFETGERLPVSEKIIEEPVTEIIEYGTSQTASRR